MLSDWLFRIRALLRHRKVEEELDEELNFHLAQQIAANMKAGMSAEEARRRARLEFGGAEQVKEECREARGVRLVEDLWRDIGYAARMMTRQPAFAAVVVLTLALGIGANAAIFQLLNAVQFRTLPVSEPQQLFEIRPARNARWGATTGRRPLVSYSMFEETRSRQEAFSALFVWGTARYDLSAAGESRLVDGIWVSGDFFDVLGVRAAVGRVLKPADDVRGCGAPGVVISYPFWQREYSGDPKVIGRAIHLDGHAFDIVGVTPASFTGIEVGRSFDVAVPVCAEPLMEPAENALNKKHFWWLDMIGRLKPGWTEEKANAHLAAISRAVFSASAAPAFPPDYLKEFSADKLIATPAGTGVSYLRREYQRPLWILLALAVLVQAIACANLANLLLARGSARHKEIAVRLAIGASRTRIVRQLLTESLLLATVGAALGGLVAQWASRALVAFISTDTSRLFFDLQFDWRVFAFTGGLALATCLLFGLAPAVRTTRQDAAAAVKMGRSVGEPGGRLTTRRLLVSVQVALSLVLVVGALLFVQTVRNLTTMDAGFRTDNIMVADFDTRAASIPPSQQVAFLRALQARVAAVPGVEVAANAAIEPGTGSVWNDIVIVNGVRVKPITNENHVSPGFFKVLGIPLLAGRDFNEHDVPGATRVAIVNEQFAKRLLRTESPIGRTFRLQVGPGEPDPVYEVVGVVANTKYNDLRDPIGPIAYFPEAQDINPAKNGEPLAEVQVLIHGSVPVADLRPAITAAAREINPTMLVNYRMLGEGIQRTFLRERLMALLSVFFGGLATLLATIGLYGVMSYMIARRRNEIGVRLALGAGRRDVMNMVVKDAALFVAAGLAGGLALSLAATRTAGALLFGVTPWDAGTLAAATLGLAAVAVAASLVPALRASRLDPTEALRQE